MNQDTLNRSIVGVNQDTKNLVHSWGDPGHLEPVHSWGEPGHLEPVHSWGEPGHRREPGMLWDGKLEPGWICLEIFGLDGTLMSPLFFARCKDGDKYGGTVHYLGQVGL